VNVSPSGHYLIDHNGDPFFWQADTSWCMVHCGTDEEISEYLGIRKRMGYTVVQTVVGALRNRPHSPNVYGCHPWRVVDDKWDPGQPIRTTDSHRDY
jgi:hypothetical protein